MKQRYSSVLCYAAAAGANLFFGVFNTTGNVVASVQFAFALMLTIVAIYVFSN